MFFPQRFTTSTCESRRGSLLFRDSSVKSYLAKERLFSDFTVPAVSDRKRNSEGIIEGLLAERSGGVANKLVKILNLNINSVKK